jgi:hypothetical protein
MQNPIIKVNFSDSLLRLRRIDPLVSCNIDLSISGVGRRHKLADVGRWLGLWPASVTNFTYTEMEECC